ncbi:hypothetical protein AGDE_15784 [Angomonas deanei]|uniref:Uncharacterized protein n=1 Tax=Angomonas deanei TaxID=59799 RepID=A0A7G2CRR9_9TRYP|nr:hypothetical protein AGDE_15784 [Angomonas deanei]CAD2221847.1 hypothetical protein, conserved [Angomonas deanei]|eukprot:EPY18473.1 hypothetical protein AGDE_15784 [Angomonas deanei]
MDPELSKSIELYRNKISEYQRFLNQSRDETAPANTSTFSHEGSTATPDVSAVRRPTGLPVSEARSDQPLMDRFSEILEEKMNRSNTLYRPHTSPSRENPADAFIKSQLQQAGRYYTTSPPDGMYNKTVAWQNRRDRTIESQRREKEMEVRERCSFTPHTTTRTRSLSGGAKGARGHSPALEDPAVLQHRERLEAARRRKREEQKKLSGPDIRKWKNEVTVPHEFQLSTSPRRQQSPRTTTTPRRGQKTAPAAAAASKTSTEDAYIEALFHQIVTPLEEKVRQRDEIIIKQKQLIDELQRQIRALTGAAKHVDYSREL